MTWAKVVTMTAGLGLDLLAAALGLVGKVQGTSKGG